MLSLLLFACSESPQDLDGDGASPPKDCDDRAADVHPRADEVPYDGIDQDCDGEDLIDVDGDGQLGTPAGGPDCDDEDPSVGAPSYDEPYDGLDQDCDGADNIDYDGDGYGAEEYGGDDCDDFAPDVNPGVAVDDCSGGDEDCDGEEDEDEDRDGDRVSACRGDCDDENPDISPRAYDIGDNGIDENCSGEDKGNCGDEAYDTRHRMWFDIWGEGCASIGNFQAVEEVTGWYLPEYAQCSGSRATWEGSMSVDATSMRGGFSLDLTSGCGDFSGEGSNAGEFCNDVTADLGFTQSCL